MGENFLQMLMGMVDSYLVAHLGLIAISGVSVAGNIITIYQAIFIALGAAISSVISKSIGQKDQSKLAYHVTEALKITLLLSFLLGFLSIFAGKEMIGLLGTERDVAESGGLYLSLVGGSIVLLGLMTSLGALIRATHNPRLPLYVSFLSNALNILFSSLAIFVLDMGIAGVAWGTIVSRLVGLVILWSQLKLPYGKPTFGLDKELLTLALPAAGERLMMRAGDVVIIALVVSFGTEAVAGNAIGEVLTQFNYMPAFGVATATVMLLARAVGEDRNLDVEVLNQVRAQSLAEKNAQVVLMPGAREVLAWADESGIQQFIYTHKGNNAFTILKDLGVESYFTEILTSQSGFVRKPSPEAATYLLDKYQLNSDNTYYIGDRTLDVEFAQNSGIQSINFLESTYEGNHRIQALADISRIFETK